MKTHYPQSDAALELYAITRGSGSVLGQLTPPTPQVMEALWPLLLERGGPVPGAAGMTFEIALSLKTAQAFFYADGKLVALCAVAMAASEESPEMWAWICEWMKPPGHTKHSKPPAAPKWAAFACSPSILEVCSEHAREFADFIPLLLAAIPAWVALQN